RRHVAAVFEKCGKDLPVSRNDWILFVEDVKANRSVVRVNHNLYGISDVVYVASHEIMMTRIRKTTRVSESIEHPVESSIVRHYDIGIAIVSKKGRDAVNYVGNSSID